AEIHRLELERVRLEHEHLAAAHECERLGQNVRTLLQEQGDLAVVLQSLCDEIQQCSVAAEAQLHKKTEQEHAFAERQTAFSEAKKSLEAVDSGGRFGRKERQHPSQSGESS